MKIFFKYIATLILLISPLLINGQTQTENYVLTRVYQIPKQSVTTVNDSIIENITYFDGLGRAKQSIGIGQSPLQQDIVTHMSYDVIGRQDKEFLPYVAPTQNGQIITGDIAAATQTYYKTNYADDFSGVSLPEVNAYSQKEFEASPLNRVLKQAAPGKDWKLGNGHEIKFEYDTNIANEVRLYYVTTSFANKTYTPTLQENGFYNVGELYKTITRDENWQATQSYIKDHTTEEFKNKQGQVILKRTYNKDKAHDTYYVYDDLGNLSYVLPPRVTTENGVSNEELTKLCYQYKYDYRNRLVEKKIPGKGWEYIIYDKLDRPVLTQDQNQRNQSPKEWLFTKYDVLGRVAYTGFKQSSTPRVIMQQYADTGDYTQYESRASTAQIRSGTKLFYTKSTIPGVFQDIYTINYYDDYNVDLPDGLGNSITTSYGITSTSRTKGLATVSQGKVLGTSNWITTVTYYDDKARPIYVYSKNEFLNTVDIVESKLDAFTGRVEETKTTHKKTGKTDIVTIDTFEYDHMDRLIGQTQKNNNQISERVVRNNYDELGQLESKLIGNGTKKGYKNVTLGVGISNDIITKTGGQPWTVGLATLGNIQGNGYVEFIPLTNNKSFIVGLSDQDIDSRPDTMDFGIYVHSGSSLRIKEAPDVSFFANEPYEIGDILRVERIGTEIYYKRNGKTFYKSKKTSTGVLLGDVTMYHDGGKFKDFKIVDNSKGLQKVDYAYNVRGWLKNINQDNINDNDLFNFSIKYNTPTNLSKALFNGNISQTNWNSSTTNTTSNPVSNQYTYTYDALNRLLSATGSNTSNYNVSGIQYDKNGNILDLQRRGYINSAVTSFGKMDVLKYTYDNGNKLRKVVDNGNDIFGFKDGTNSGDDYTYDDNGNMLTDANKGISNIRYNHLNLPIEVTFDNDANKRISYAYDTAGMKLRKVVKEGSTTTVTDYAGNYIYKNNELEFFNHPEGYVSPTVTSSGVEMSYVYQYKDHLGNVRLSYTDSNNDGVITASTEIVEESNYYPFGLKHKGYNIVTSSLGNSTAQKFGYNGKELEESLGINWMEMDMRQYDPAIARWTSIDPVIHHSMSTYNAFDNNPVFWADPSGADAVENENGWTFTGEDAQNVFRALRDSYNSGPGDGKKNKKKKSKKKGVKDMNTGELYGMAYNGYARTAYLNGNDPYNPTESDIAESEAARDEAAYTLAMFLTGEWATAKLFQGAAWAYRAYQAKRSFNAIKGGYATIISNSDEFMEMVIYSDKGDELFKMWSTLSKSDDGTTLIFDSINGFSKSGTAPELANSIGSSIIRYKTQLYNWVRSKGFSHAWFKGSRMNVPGQGTSALPGKSIDLKVKL